ncbi:uncharacterized protein Z518_10257 [Rhinocladiella mackenziei CBS 650.93]|uniref:Zn(2)-C6 fungal-type domain-containing protein n=1 Tax=Rhinocladiella mackenziei CBS 650.93 TaxID=1442369 RepID=A0A0D2ITR6_9EURO|nr:uncharacterized protein Z518_10257 [Rhinocladiella mackenziei CBS 650.93]KIX00120.1 hypothetical protein Z518_10257 [Rhinocladiella mackenziei CBS 650.93]
MVTTKSVNHQASENELTSSPEAGSRGFVAVNHASSNESDSSQLSSPQDRLPRGEVPSHAPNGMYPLPNGQDANAQKRKRSESNGVVQYAQQRQHEYSPSRQPEPQHMANRALHVLGNTDPNGTAYYPNSTSVDQNGHTWQTERPSQPTPALNGVRPNTSEAQLAEVLQRETHAQETQPKPWDLQPSTNGDVNPDQYGPDGATIGTPAQKRKRNFANRTKTGCMTCRQRKKKCDEQHPICRNCIRGGFQCKGYNMGRRIWPAKPAPVKVPVPLQSKDGPGDVSEPSAYQVPKNDSPDMNRPPGQGGQMQPMQMDDHDNPRQQHYATSPQNEPLGRPSPYPGQQPPPPSQQQWAAQPSQTSYTSDHLPPLAELGRSDTSSAHPRDMSRPPAQGTPHTQHSSMTPSHQTQPPAPPHHPLQHAPPPPPPPQTGPPNISHTSGPATQHPSHWGPPQQPDYRHTYAPPGPPAPEHHTPPSHVRMTSASFDQPKSGAKTFNKEDVERSKMLRGTYYNHFDATLQNERQRCAKALARFNEASKFDSGLGPEEIWNVLLKVFEPWRDTTHKFLSPLTIHGVLSPGVVIEAPFRCTYGYNIKMMDCVYVGSNTKIDDAGKVEIGARAWIGPNVTILTTDVGKDLVYRRGSEAAWIAQPVIIASEVIIGEGAVIYPGVRLEKGCTVEPFAIVRDNLRENEVQRAAVGERIAHLV